VKRFMFLHFGFEKPTPEIMEAWKAWFESISDKQIDQGGFSSGREISKSGTRVRIPAMTDTSTGDGGQRRSVATQVGGLSIRLSAMVQG
jgi:hypothetical protein